MTTYGVTLRRSSLQARQATWRRVDWALLLAVLALVGFGTMLVWSATYQRDEITGGDSEAFLVRHVVNFLIGSLLAVTVAATDPRWVRIWSPLVYIGSLAGLVAVLVPGVGVVINGSQSWIRLAGQSIQPAELAKVAVIVGMALLFAEKREGEVGDQPRSADVVQALLVAAVPTALVVLQPDLGTVMVMGAIVFGVLAAAGVAKKWLLGLVALAAAGAIAALQLHVLEDYQVARFTTFANPETDPRGIGYNTIQARIAIGNGGIFGQGWREGSQTQSRFVPEQHTDFIFTAAGEELGLIGAGAILLLFVVVLWRASRIAYRADDLFGRLVAAGVTCWFGFQAFENIGMTLGLTPVTGLPLPFVSYGGTSMFANCVAVGLLLGIHARTSEDLP